MTFNRKNQQTKQPESVEHGYNYALFLLGLSMRTEFEIRRKMQLRGYTQEVIDEVIKQLFVERLLDDRNYTEVYIRNLKKYRTFGYYGIRKKLIEKQIPKDIVEELLDQEVTLKEEVKLAKKILEKELGTIYQKSALAQKQKQKLGRKLQSKGFRMDVISKVLF